MLTWFRWASLMIVVGAVSFYGYRAIPWSCMDATVSAYWVQAVGSITAIVFAYFLGDRQSRVALRAVSEADRLAAYRKVKAILAVTDAAQSHAFGAMKAFNEDGFDYLVLKLRYDDETMKNLIDAFAAIPIHELGTYNSVAAILRIRNSMRYFQNHINRCMAQAEASRDPSTGGVKSFQLFDTAAIRMCLEEIIACNKTLNNEVEQMMLT